MLRILWTDHETKNNVLNQAGTERYLLNTIRKSQAEFLGHRKSSESKKLENLGPLSYDRQVRQQERARKTENRLPH